MPNAPDFGAIQRRLQAVDQDHALRFYDRLDAPAQASLLNLLNSLDLESLPGLVDRYVKHKPVFELPEDVQPARFYPVGPDSPMRRWDRAAYKTAGGKLLREGKIGAFVVAGGQGSRLGFEGPKGCFPAGAVTGKPLFQIFAEGLRAARAAYGKAVPWYIMTSPLNHAATVAFFQDHRYFGLDRADVMFFPQGVMPSLDIKSGKMLLASPGEVATNPDGHGGSLTALKVSGALEDMKRRGIAHLSYFQVDNPTVKVLDPVFIGLHAAAPDSSGEMSSKMIAKAYPEEKLGVFCSVDGRTAVIEYSDLPADLASQRVADGSLRFSAGSMALHILGVDFIVRINSDPRFSLPYHRAEKKIPCINPETGKPIQPTANNGVKLERFVFDAIPLCRASIVYETDRAEEFAPIKNATGPDSIETSHHAQTARAARWLAAAGVKVPRRADGTPDCVLEISPLTACSAEDLIGKSLPRVIEPGARVAL